MTETRAPVGRGMRARRRVLRAALDVLADDGMPGFTIESVARRAGASKATVYRHWASPSALLVDAMDAEFRPLADVDTGDLRADLVALLSLFAASLTGSPFPQLMAAFTDAAERDPALGEMHAELTRRRREPLLRVLTAAVARDELPRGTDADLVVDLLAAPFFYRRLIAHQDIPEDLAGRVVDHVLAGLRPGEAVVVRAKTPTLGARRSDRQGN
ncbi:TetR/AcrR family transcriptional regulator [Actinomycetospora sp. TBRC 11914]|uniref:TetR/AcrR family transcriptional regulator n=1 Tax=Actinomycetospora sp. TBRC 11914 TaxID=2729387 RepID=UPI00145EDE82|nr:TetR/AcrR family transcriptional regulator [Actinomycetospora sp. TBRC 11914]NMO93711.1 TetR/AcrR family transcriptional regulator [Actinomycetospora sp. TBRC 11914]